MVCEGNTVARRCETAYAEAPRVGSRFQLAKPLRMGGSRFELHHTDEEQRAVSCYVRLVSLISTWQIYCSIILCSRKLHAKSRESMRLPFLGMKKMVIKYQSFVLSPDHERLPDILSMLNTL